MMNDKIEKIIINEVKEMGIKVCDTIIECVKNGNDTKIICSGHEKDAKTACSERIKESIAIEESEKTKRTEHHWRWINNISSTLCSMITR